MTEHVLEAIEETLIESAASIREEIAGGATERGVNPSGERQLAADVAADRLLAEGLGSLEGVGWYASEERADPINVGTGYAVTVDPLDGSSNLQSNNPVGTIVGVYDQALPAPGESIIAAWYVLYGPRTTIVGTTGDEVTEHTIDGGSISTSKPIAFSDAPVVYGFGGRVPDWTPAFHEFVQTIEAELKLRYSGAMVADVNQVLTYGGIFGYPGLVEQPAGKLRLQFEALPMAKIVETSGGASSDGGRSILARSGDALHERTPVFLGDESLINRLEAAIDPPP